MKHLKRYKTDAEYNSDKSNLQWPTVCGIDSGEKAKFISTKNLAATVTMYSDKKNYTINDNEVQATIVIAHNLTEPCNIELSCEDSNVTISQDTFTNVIGAVSTYMTYPLTTQDGVNGSKTFDVTAEITSADQSIEENAELIVNNILSRVIPITITSGSNSKLYDGIEFSDNTYSITSGSLLNGHRIADATISGRITNAGSVTNTISNAVILNSNNENVTNTYSITYVSGTLTVEQRNVIMTSASDTKTYDGFSLTNDEIDVTGDGFATDQGATYDVAGDQILVGGSQNIFAYTLTPNTNSDNYNITTHYGTLTVTDGTGEDDEPVPDELVVYIEETSEPEDSGGYVSGETVTYEITIVNIYQETKSVSLQKNEGLTIIGVLPENINGGDSVTIYAQNVITTSDEMNGAYTAIVTATIGSLTKTAEITVICQNS